jgi:hypothetical protein
MSRVKRHRIRNTDCYHRLNWRRASFIGPAEDGSIPTPPTSGQTHEAPVNETPPTDEGNATATMLANSTPFTVDGAAALVGAAAAGVVGAAAAGVVRAAAAGVVGAAAPAMADAAAAAGVGAAAAAMVGAAAATDGVARDACTPYERRSPAVAGLDSTPRGPAHPPPPGPPPAQSHMAPEIEAKNSLISLILRLGCHAVGTRRIRIRFYFHSKSMVLEWMGELYLG